MALYTLWFRTSFSLFRRLVTVHTVGLPFGFSAVRRGPVFPFDLGGDIGAAGVAQAAFQDRGATAVAGILYDALALDATSFDHPQDDSFLDAGSFVNFQDRSLAFVADEAGDGIFVTFFLLYAVGAHLSGIV